jgi:hypothetical protein
VLFISQKSIFRENIPTLYSYKMISLFTAILFFVFGITAPADDVEPIRVLYVTGGGYHDYEAQEQLLSEELTKHLDIE